MTKIGLLSDTHAFWDDKYLKYFESCEEIRSEERQVGKECTYWCRPLGSPDP